MSPWGWATWKDRWAYFNPDANYHLHSIESKKQIKEFNLDNSYDYQGLLKAQIEGRVNSWAVCWYATIFAMNGLTLYPRRSLTENIGTDGSGTHYTLKTNRLNHSAFYMNLTNLKKLKINFPDKIETDPIAFNITKAYLKKIDSPDLLQKIKTKIKRTFRL